MGARENECQISQIYILHMKYLEFYLCNHNSREIWHSFSRSSMRNFLSIGVTKDDLLHF